MLCGEGAGRKASESDREHNVKIRVSAQHSLQLGVCYWGSIAISKFYILASQQGCVDVPGKVSFSFYALQSGVGRQM